MIKEIENMTDEQFEAYNKLISLIDEMIECNDLTEENKKLFKEKKSRILDKNK